MRRRFEEWFHRRFGRSAKRWYDIWIIVGAQPIILLIIISFIPVLLARTSGPFSNILPWIPFLLICVWVYGVRPYHRSIKQALWRKGYRFVTISDCSAIVSMYKASLLSAKLGHFSSLEMGEEEELVFSRFQPGSRQMRLFSIIRGLPTYEEARLLPVWDNNDLLASLQYLVRLRAGLPIPFDTGDLDEDLDLDDNID